MFGFDLQQGQVIFSSLQRPDYSGGHPASYTMGTGQYFLLPARETNHSPSSNTEVENMWLNTSTPAHFFMA